MELISLPAGSGEIILKLPAEWVRRSLLEGGKKLTLLAEAVKEMERMDFEYVVYPKLLAEREREERQKRVEIALLPPVEKPRKIEHLHRFATIKKKLWEKGLRPYCLGCGFTQVSNLKD